MCTVHLFSFCPQIQTNIPFTTLSQSPDTEWLRKTANEIDTDYILFDSSLTPLKLFPDSAERLLDIARQNKAAMLYSDFWEVKNGTMIPHPTIEYQTGSLRDDFDFGPLILYRTTAFKEAVSRMVVDYHHAALYDLRLKISQKGSILHIPEFLYQTEESDHRLSGEKQFDYINPKNREVQIEMEKVCTSYLREIGAWLPPCQTAINLQLPAFPIEASVIIPVRNREKTIADAVKSALSQQTSFPYNVIVVDNHSTDGTTNILQELSRQNPQLIHHIPSSLHLGIGGCWNAAVTHSLCGKFAIQLDSDDLYNSTDVIQTIVNTFHKEQCAMVIGSYQMVNFKLEEIPPGIIDHREWTPENGHNNALRINGLGAPRAFYTPVIRKHPFPNVSYGEDYAAGLTISRQFRIGRIYTPLYLCRRWEENSDSNIDINKQNIYNFYKDKLRTLELASRLLMNNIQ